MIARKSAIGSSASQEPSHRNKADASVAKTPVEQKIKSKPRTSTLSSSSSAASTHKTPIQVPSHTNLTPKNSQVSPKRPEEQSINPRPQTSTSTSSSVKTTNTQAQASSHTTSTPEPSQASVERKVSTDRSVKSSRSSLRPTVFDESLGPLPPNWNCTLDAQGRIYDSNFFSQTTTWNDPRLPEPVITKPKRKSLDRSKSLSRSDSAPSKRKTLSASLSRSPEKVEILKKGKGPEQQSRVNSESQKFPSVIRAPSTSKTPSLSSRRSPEKRENGKEGTRASTSQSTDVSQSRKQAFTSMERVAVEPEALEPVPQAVDNLSMDELQDDEPHHIDVSMLEDSEDELEGTEEKEGAGEASGNIEEEPSIRVREQSSHSIQGFDMVHDDSRASLVIQEKEVEDVVDVEENRGAVSPDSSEEEDEAPSKLLAVQDILDPEPSVQLDLEQSSKKQSRLQASSRSLPSQSTSASSVKTPPLRATSEVGRILARQVDSGVDVGSRGSTPATPLTSKNVSHAPPQEEPERSQSVRSESSAQEAAVTEAQRLCVIAEVSVSPSPSVDHQEPRTLSQSMRDRVETSCDEERREVFGVQSSDGRSEVDEEGETRGTEAGQEQDAEMEEVVETSGARVGDVDSSRPKSATVPHEVIEILDSSDEEDEGAPATPNRRGLAADVDPRASRSRPSRPTTSTPQASRLPAKVATTLKRQERAIASVSDDSDAPVKPIGAKLVDTRKKKRRRISSPRPPRPIPPPLPTFREHFFRTMEFVIDLKGPPITFTNDEAEFLEERVPTSRCRWGWELSLSSPIGKGVLVDSETPGIAGLDQEARCQHCNWYTQERKGQDPEEKFKPLKLSPHLVTEMFERGCCSIYHGKVTLGPDSREEDIIPGHCGDDSIGEKIPCQNPQIAKRIEKGEAIGLPLNVFRTSKKETGWALRSPVRIERAQWIGQYTGESEFSRVTMLVLLGWL